MSIIFLCLTIQVHLILEDEQQENFRHCQIGKRTCTIFDGIRHQRTVSPRLYMDKEEEAN